MICLKPDPQWKAILRKAWSIRLMLLAALLSGIEAALPILHHFGFLEFLPGGFFALLSFIVVAAAFVARLIAQQGLD